MAGPFKVNGVPLRRVNQAYVIATSTKVDVSKADVGKIADDFFKKAKKAAKKGESEFFTEDKEVSAPSRLSCFTCALLVLIEKLVSSFLSIAAISVRISGIYENVGPIGAARQCYEDLLRNSWILFLLRQSDLSSTDDYAGQAD